MSLTAGIKKGPRSDINITPYIDILLVLLIIFMVATPIRQMDLKIRAAQPSQPPKPRVELLANAIVISVGEHGQIAINRTPTDIGTLGSRLREIYRARPNMNMFISADSKLPYGDIVKVIDISKGAGISDIGLLSEEIR